LCSTFAKRNRLLPKTREWQRHDQQRRPPLLRCEVAGGYSSSSIRRTSRSIPGKLINERVSPGKLRKDLPEGRLRRASPKIALRPRFPRHPRIPGTEPISPVARLAGFRFPRKRTPPAFTKVSAPHAAKYGQTDSPPVVLLLELCWLRRIAWAVARGGSPPHCLRGLTPLLARTGEVL
jgi:hypothetical protein